MRAGLGAVFLRSMNLLFTVFDSRYPVLLCLAVGGYYFWQSTRAAAPFQASGALLALLLLAHPPVLLLIRFSMARAVALPFTLTLFGSSLLLLRAVSPAFRLILPPPRWHRLTGTLLVLDAVIAASWSYVPPATLLLPGWLTATLVLGAEAAFSGLLLYWFWHAQPPARLHWFLNPQVTPTLALAQHAYDQQAGHLQPTPAEFMAWLRTLPLPARQVARRGGVELMWTTPLFRRFVLEARGHRYVDFMAEHLSQAEFIRWVDATYASR